ncbi:mechanosensitive ion channel family protein [Iningainema tapete]|uniref:Mechanosensitive ion channel n=1 Tax=Iningainema tapete BLCC-T55 TaxID=2748662 RepID=A0A8J6XRG5_9CYAN|nr:mechanosensitive ion channel domain-containing protein [Iningainema tapete]MBD2775222.1 mechanosensitive ion channel [Iningainema tapete BLCC-T55]
MSRHRCLRRNSTILAIALMVIQGCFLTLIPVQAQQKQVNAPIILDGYKLFEVSQSGQFSAEDRADDANLILKQVVRSTKPVKVEIVKSNQLPVIRVNGRHLLSVTQQDTPTGRTEQEQAEIWAQQIAEALQQGQEQRKLSYVWRAILFAVLSGLGAYALHRLSGWIWRYWLRQLVPRAASDPDTGAQPKSIELFLLLTLTVVRAGIWLGTTIYITNLFPLTRYWSQQITSILWLSLTSPAISLGKSSYSVINLIILFCLFFGVVAIAGAVTNLLRSRVLRITRVSRGVQESIALIFNYSLIFIGAFVLLQIWGLDISSLAIVASVLGVAIGFGFQGIAKEFISGLVITFERAIEVGDFIEIGKFMGTVERLNARSTQIRTLDDTSVIVPNSHLLENEVVNWNHQSLVSRLVLPVRVAYGSTLSNVRSALLEAAKDNPNVLKKPAPNVFFKGFGEDFLDFQLLVWISQPQKQFQIRSDLYFRIEEMMRLHQVHIPFPQRSVHVQSGNLPLQLSPELEESLSHLSQGLTAWLNQTQSEKFNGSTNSSTKNQPDER